MKKFGVQYVSESLKVLSKKGTATHNTNNDYLEILEVLSKFQDGYTKRDIEKIEDFVGEIFVKGNETSILGTGTGELFLGVEQVKTLIRDDFEYWGDMNIDLENVHIENINDSAWFAAQGTVKYTFKDTDQRYDSYLNFIKNKAEEPGLTPRQKITFINWALALTYHQRLEEQREYLWPLRLTGVLIKEMNKWKIKHLNFSMPQANFPDERFESSKDYIESYINQNELVDKYVNNHMTTELKTLLKNFQTDLIGHNDISRNVINKYFGAENIPNIIATDDQCCIGVEQVKEFFNGTYGSTLSLDLEHAIASKSGEITWVTAWGTLKQTITEDELDKQVLGELERLFKSQLTSKAKIFAAHRSTAYALKESSSGENYTCPISLTAIILNHKEKYIFQNIHFSLPFSWILEGKIDGI